MKQTHRADLILDQLERVQLEFVYDSQGRRMKKTVRTWNGSSFVQINETLFIYDGWNLLAEIDSSSQSVIRSYTWGHDLSGHAGVPRPGVGAGGVGGLLSVETGTGLFLPSYDHNGNITAYSDSTGDVVAEFEYDPFGRLLWETGEHAEELAHRFSSKYLDKESGYYYYGFRHYDPESGRWVNRDPIGERGGLNLYEFIGNNGQNNIDILGLAQEFVVEFEHTTSFLDGLFNTGIGLDITYDFEWKCNDDGSISYLEGDFSWNLPLVPDSLTVGIPKTNLSAGLESRVTKRLNGPDIDIFETVHGPASIQVYTYSILLEQRETLSIPYVYVYEPEWQPVSAYVLKIVLNCCAGVGWQEVSYELDPLSFIGIILSQNE